MCTSIQREGEQGREGVSKSVAKKVMDAVCPAGSGGAPFTMMDLREIHGHTAVSVHISDGKSMKANAVS